MVALPETAANRASRRRRKASRAAWCAACASGGARQHAHRARRDDRDRAFTAPSTAARQSTSMPHSARNTTPAASIVIDGPDGVARLAFGVTIITGTNVAPRPRGASAERRAPPCATQRDAESRSRSGLQSPTPPRRTHIIPQRCGPSPSRSSVGGGQRRSGSRHGLVVLKRQRYGRPYMRTLPGWRAHIFPATSLRARWGQNTASPAAGFDFIDPRDPETREMTQ